MSPSPVGHEAAVRSVAFLANGNWLLTGGADAAVVLWKLADGKAAGTFRKHGGPAVRAAFADNGRQTVRGDQDGQTFVWGVERFLPKKP